MKSRDNRNLVKNNNIISVHDLGDLYKSKLSKLVSLMNQNRHRTAPRRPKTLPKPPKTAPRRPRTLPRRHQDGSRGPHGGPTSAQDGYEGHQKWLASGMLALETLKESPAVQYMEYMDQQSRWGLPVP